MVFLVLLEFWRHHIIDLLLLDTNQRGEVGWVENEGKKDRRDRVLSGVYVCVCLCGYISLCLGYKQSYDGRLPFPW